MPAVDAQNDEAESITELLAAQTDAEEAHTVEDTSVDAIAAEWEGGGHHKDPAEEVT